MKKIKAKRSRADLEFDILISGRFLTRIGVMISSMEQDFQYEEHAEEVLKALYQARDVVVAEHDRRVYAMGECMTRKILEKDGNREF